MMRRLMLGITAGALTFSGVAIATTDIAGAATVAVQGNITCHINGKITFNHPLKSVATFGTTKGTTTFALTACTGKTGTATIGHRRHGRVHDEAADQRLRSEPEQARHGEDHLDTDDQGQEEQDHVPDYRVHGHESDHAHPAGRQCQHVDDDRIVLDQACP